MSNVFRFPHGRRIPAATIPREEFERLAALSLDVVDQIVALLNDLDGDDGQGDGADAQPSLVAPVDRGPRFVWLRGNKRDFET